MINYTYLKKAHVHLLGNDRVRKFCSTYQARKKSNDSNRTSLLEPSSLDIQLIITVSKHVQIIPKAIHNSTNSAGNGVRQSSNEGNSPEITESLEDVLVAALDAVEFVSLLVVSWCGVKVRVAYVVLLAAFHNRATDDGVGDYGKYSTGKEHIAVVVGNFDGENHCILSSGCGGRTIIVMNENRVKETVRRNDKEQRSKNDALLGSVVFFFCSTMRDDDR